MNPKLRLEDIQDMFITITEHEIHAAVATIKAGEEKDQLMGQGYILAVERCRTILRSIMKDVEC